MPDFTITYTNDTVVHGVFTVNQDSIEGAYAAFDRIMEGTNAKIKSVIKK